jgi:hypothetical protein
MLYCVKKIGTKYNITYVAKVTLTANKKSVAMTEEYTEEVMNWFREYTYLVRDDYSLKNFIVSPLKHHNDKIKICFELEDTYSLFDVSTIIRLLLNPDIKNEFPLFINGVSHNVSSENPEF